jgi:hypothetical protein
MKGRVMIVGVSLFDGVLGESGVMGILSVVLAFLMWCLLVGCRRSMTFLWSSTLGLQLRI